MNAVVHAINAAGQAFVAFALPMLIQSAVLVLILLFVDFVLRRRVRAVFRYWIWMLVLLKLVLPPSLCSPVSFGTWFGRTLEAPTAVLDEAPAPEESEMKHGWQPQAQLGDGVPSANPIIQSFAPKAAPPITLVDRQPAREPGPRPKTPPVTVATETDIAPAAPPAPTLSWQALVLLTWAATALAFLLLLLQRAYFVRGLVAQAQEAPPSLLAVLDDCRARMRLNQPVALRISPNASSPAVCGLLRPVVLIPKNLAPKLQPCDLQAVLLHELAHVKRGDLWVNLIQTLLQIVYFYHPLLWLANLMIRRVREQAVDEAVLVAMGDTAHDYPETLLSVAKLAFRKRPALSLRLIGVVESKSALSGRIKHILSRPLPKSAKLGLLGLTTVLIVAAFLLPMAQAMQPEPTVENSGPLDIRLVGVCPDGSDELYDARGRKLETTTPAHGVFNTLWSNDEQQRDFIFAIPDVEGQLLFLSAPHLRPVGARHRVGGGFRSQVDTIENPATLVESITFQRTYRKSWAGLFTRHLPIRLVDLTLQYFYGPPREAICTFTGPFTKATTVQADQGRPYRLTPEAVDATSVCQIKFHCATNQPFADTNVPVVVYDEQGNRHLVHNSSRRGGQRGTHLVYEAAAVPWDEIAAITIGEQPHEITFRNISTHYPKRPSRTYPPYLDEMAERLQLTGMSAEQVLAHQYKSVEEVIAVLDLIRGHGRMEQVMLAMAGMRPWVDLAALDAASRDKILTVAGRWFESPSTAMRAYGARLGLMAGAREFFEPALALLDYRHPTDDRQTRAVHHAALRGLAAHSQRMSAADVEQVKQFVEHCPDGYILNRLFSSCLRVARQPAAREALWELAQDDRPWLWWPAIAALINRNDEWVRPGAALSERMKLRVIAVSQIEWPNETPLAPQIGEMLAGMFTVETMRMCPGHQYEMHRAVSRYLNRKQATALYVDFLRAARPASVQWQFEKDHGSTHNLYYVVSALLRDINLWYGVDFGQLGVFEPGVVNESIRMTGAFEQATAEALNWYRTGQALEPAPPALEGQVTGTNHRGVPGATVILKWQKLIVGETGQQSQQIVEVARQETDRDGGFAFKDVVNTDNYYLDIEAERLAKRVHLSVNQLADGRFRIDDSEANNTVVLERPSRLSGRVIGRDGGTLTEGRLSRSSYPTHAGQRHGGCGLDDQGHFAIDPIPAGYHVLRYNGYRRHSEAGDYDGATAYQLVCIQEGEAIEDVVLDLRESTATLEVEIVNEEGQPVAADRLSLDVPLPSGQTRPAQVMFATEMEPQRVHRFPNLPPMEGRLWAQVDGRPRRGVALQLHANQTTRCRLTLDVSAGGGPPIGRPQRREVFVSRAATELPNGVGVELAGISKHPSAGQPWWRYDGSPLEKAPYDKAGGNVYPSAFETAYEFAVRLHDLPDGAAVTMKTEPSGSRSTGMASPDLRWLATALPSDVEQCRLLVGVATGPWEATASANGDSPITLGSGLGGVMFSQARTSSEDGVTITVTDDMLERSCRVVALTKEGQTVTASPIKMGTAGKARQTTAHFANVALSDITEFQFQTRPWNWAKLNKVSLRPGRNARHASATRFQKRDQGRETDASEVSAPLPWTGRTEKVMPVAEQEARRLNHAYVGTEHILLALARQETAVSAQVLNKLGADIETLRTEIDKLIQPGPEPVTQRTLPLTPRAKRVLEYAREEAKTLSHDYLGTEHILLGLTEESNGIAAQVLANLNLTPLQIRAEVLNLVRSGAEDSEDSRDQDGHPSESEIGSPQEAANPLELHIAPWRHELAPGVLAECGKALAEGRMPIGNRYHWVAVRPNSSLGSNLVVEAHAGKSWLLVHSEKPYSVVPNQGWRLAHIGRNTDSQGRPMVVLRLDDTGANRIAAVTEPNAGHALVVIVNGIAVSASIIPEGTWRESAAITGDFTEPELAETVASLGQSSVAPPSKAERALHPIALRNGVMVEVIGICEHPSNGKQWWRPDGTPLPESPYDDKFGRAFPKAGEKGYKFAVRYTGLAGREVDAMIWPTSVKTTHGGVLSSTSKKNGRDNAVFINGLLNEKIIWQGAAFDEELDSCDLRIGVCLGPWKNTYRYPTDKPNDAVEWAVFENVSLCRAPERTGAGGVGGDTLNTLSERTESAAVLNQLGKALAIYANDHEDAYPETLENLSIRGVRAERKKQLFNSIAYLGRGRTMHDSPSLILAYDEALLATGGTNVLLNSYRVAFKTVDELRLMDRRPSQGPTDSDGDGLSDFQEVHKYLTDPAKQDSDGDGTPDGDWAERREYTYSVRSIFRFLPPLDEKALNDDFQDARVREQTDDYIEIEVVHYPLATVYESIDENRNWQQDDAHLTEYLAPGATTNWDAPMRRALLAELKDDGIDVDALSDKQAVDQVSRWLLKRSRSLDKVFTTFYVHCPNGRPAVFPGLEAAFRGEFERDKSNYDWTLEEHFDREVLGKGMFYNKTHGSCTSTAVYLTTVLRALGIPTRMVLASPAVDASDREQILMVKNSITHNQVRETMLAGLRRSSHGFTNHTFNEVYIGNRWVRLDYTALGPSIFGAHRFGLQTHLYTINDLSDMNLAATWGVRYAKGLRSASFQHSNPYSAIAIDDLFGVHSNVPNPPFTAQEPATSSKPNIFIFSPARVSVWDEVLEIVKDVTFNKTGRPHKREFYENLFEGVWQRKPGDILVLLFALDTEDRIPEGYEDLLIGSWSGIESSLREGMAIEMTNQTRDMKVILIAAPRAAQLESLVRNSSLLRTLGTPEEANEEGVAAEHGASLPAPFSTIQFANGVEVRFLGVCTHPSTGQPWWEPDGTPLETAPYESTGSRLEEQEGYVYYEFAAEILGGDHPSIRWKVPGGTRSSDTGQAIGPDGQHLAHTHAYTANQPLDAEVANVFLGLAADEWETPAVHARPDNEGSYTLKDGHAIAFGSAYEREGQTYVPVTTNIPYTVMAKRLVAIDIEGNLHTGGMSGSGGNVLQSSTYNFDVPLGRIKEFRFQTRPYLWIEFHNVSLRRGQKTDFRVDFAAAYNPDAVDGVTLPDVDRETVMLDLASGELVEIPRGASETNMAEAILALGRGDLVHDGGALILVRNATSEQAENMAGMPFSTYPISPDLPQALQVTTAEGHRYEIKVLAVDEGKSCTLKCTLLSEAEAVSNRVRAELPNGVTVEFLAYSHLVPRGGLFWFDPQGQETTIPGVYEADVEGLGTILALRVQPSEARLTVQVYRGPDAQNIEKQWQLPGTDIWLLALGQERNFANLRVLTEQTLPPVIETIALTEENLGQLVEVNRCGIASIVDLHVLDEAVSEMMMGEMARTMGLPPEYSMDGEMAKSMGLQDMVEPPTLGFSTINAPDSHQSIVALLDKEGRTYPVNQIEGSYPNAIYGARLWPGKLAGIVVEAAPVHSADVRLRNISLTPQRVTEIRIEPDPERQLLWRRSYASLLREILTNSIARYRKDHGGRFPSQLEALRRNHDDDAFRWLLANIAHVGADKSPDDDPRTVIAYDKTLLAQGQGTYVFYSDGQFEFESPLELTELGLLPNSSGPDTWQNMGVSVPSDANDTRSLAPGIWLDGIGSAPDSRVFISTVRDTAETEGRVYRFVLSNKADEVLAPIYYASFEQADGKLWEKYTFDTYYHYRELEAFRLQWRSAAGEVAVAPTGHGEILAAAANAPNLPRALNAPPGQHALTFDGKDDYLYVPDSESLRTAEQLKVEMWFKPQFPPGPYDHRPGWALLAKGAYLGTGRVSNQGFGIVLVKHDDCPNDFAFDFCRTSENSLNMTGVLYRQPHNWMHFSETFQRGSYIPAPGQPLVFGRFLIPSELPFRGQIAEIRLWDAATSGDTAQYEKAPLTGSEPGLLACWTFEEGAGPIARDISPNANHARLGSSITTDDNDPGWLDLGELVRDTPEP